MSTLYYKEVNYKFTLTRIHIDNLGVYGCEVETDYFKLYRDGSLIIKKDYAWDGCSFPAINTKSNRRAGLVHDVGYQLIRLGLLKPDNRAAIDKRFYAILKEDGFMFPQVYYMAVNRFAGFAINPKEEPKEQSAP